MATRKCSRISGDHESGDKIEGREKGFAKLVVSGSDAAEVLEFVEEAFDAVTFAVTILVVVKLFTARADGRNYRLDSVQSQAFANAVGIVASIEGGCLQDIIGIKAFVEAFKLPTVMGMARR